MVAYTIRYLVINITVLKFQRIENLRIDHDYTQEYVAIKLNIAREVYRRYEKGTRTIPVDCLIALAKLYNTSTDYLLGLTDTK